MEMPQSSDVAGQRDVDRYDETTKRIFHDYRTSRCPRTRFLFHGRLKRTFATVLERVLSLELLILNGKQ